MNLPLPPDPGPYGADTDDAVSAYIDGELAGFAIDHGLELDSVRATLTAWGGFEARRARLLTAQTALRTPIALDDPTRDALVAAAMAAEPAAAPVVALEPRRSRRATIIGRVAAVAAVLLLTVGGLVAFQTRGADEPRTTAGRTPTSESSPEQPTDLRPAADAPSDVAATPAESGATATPTVAPTAAPAPTIPRRELPQLGEVSDPKALQEAARSALAPQPTLTTLSPVAPSACPALVLFPTGTDVVFRGGATFNGRMAEVSIGQSAGKTLVFVIDPAACSVLSAIAF